jgi:hypothetical protein
LKGLRKLGFRVIPKFTFLGDPALSWYLNSERPGALLGPRRPLGPSCSAASDDPQLARPARQRIGRSATAQLARTRPHRLSVRDLSVCRSSGASRRPPPSPPKTRPPIKITQTTIIGSCPGPGPGPAPRKIQEKSSPIHGTEGYRFEPSGQWDE